MNVQNKFIYFLLTVFFFYWGCSMDKSSPMTEAEKVERGAYLVQFGGCNDCHSPKIFTDMGPAPDTRMLLSGHPQNLKFEVSNKTDAKKGYAITNEHLTAWMGPWGVSYASNITPDKQTGIGNWTEEMFIQSMRNGKHMGNGRQLLPPMPWFNIKDLSDSDLKTIYAYLQSVPPVNNLVPGPLSPDQVLAVKN